MGKSDKINETINKFNKEKKIIAKGDNNNLELNSFHEIKLNKYLQEIESLKNDRKLKRNTQKFIKRILSSNVYFALVLIVVNAFYKYFTNRELYTEYFLIVLIGSQLIVMPFVLLKIITKHLFPNKDK